jgi:hypothetical protein
LRLKGLEEWSAEDLNHVRDSDADHTEVLKLVNLKHHQEHLIKHQRYGLMFLSVVIVIVGEFLVLHF